MAAALADHPFFSSMPASALRRIGAHVYRRDYAAGEELFHEGADADRFFLIRRGAVRLDIDVPGRGRIDVEQLGQDAVIGWSWLFSPYTWHLSATATERTSVLVLDAGTLRTLMAADPVLGYELMRRFAAVMFDRLQATRLRLSTMNLYEAEIPMAPVAGPGAGKRLVAPPRG